MTGALLLSLTMSNFDPVSLWALGRLSTLKTSTKLDTRYNFEITRSLKLIDSQQVGTSFEFEG